jgi:hypothetical protein
MKQKILMVSLGAAFLASIFGISAVLGQNGGISPEAFMSTLRLYQMAGIFGLFGIASFFVGLAYPAGSVTTYNTLNGGQGSETKTVVNG